MKEKGLIMSNHQGTVVIYGCGGHSRNVADVLLLNNPGINIIFVDINAHKGESILGFPVIKELKHNEAPCIIALGNNLERKMLFNKINKKRIISVISKQAHLGYHSQIGVGSYVGHHSIIGPEAVIGENCLISYGSIIGHETVVGSNSFVGPNACISGRGKIGDMVFIGAGATIIEKIQVCSHAIIGAGTTVVKDILEPGTYVGTPVRRIK